MKYNKITIIINKPVEKVFKFTTSPQHTHLWIPSIIEELSEEYPPKINTRYKNRGGNSDWDFYRVMEFEKNKVFTLTDLDGNYHVKYTYRKIDNNKTEMEYFEWMKSGELSKPFTKSVLLKLRSVMENEN
ncbi:hypothetical protein KAI56_03805 [Candidatus Parcubacteria bacterium]|nr:hypothetical protein [Candidatus Parcubacteria bacterium]